jgi:hypothetical protein
MAEKFVQIPGTDIKTQWVLVSPDIAKRYLESNTKNRNMRDKHIARLVKDMKEGIYTTHHQGVAFDEDNILVDGQHRHSGYSSPPGCLLNPESVLTAARNVLLTT